MADTTEGSGLSAYEARRIVRRVKPQRKNAAPQDYKITKGGKPFVEGKFAVVQKVCQMIKPSTLKRRLDDGDRSWERLSRDLEPTTTRKRKIEGYKIGAGRFRDLD